MINSTDSNKLPAPAPKAPSTSFTLSSTGGNYASVPVAPNHGLFAIPTLSSSMNRGGLMSMSLSATSMDLMDSATPVMTRKSIPLDFFQPSPSMDEGLAGLSSFSRDWAMMQSKDYRPESSIRAADSLRTDSLAQLEMILTPRPPGLVSASSHSSSNLQTSSLDSIGSNFFQSSNVANHDGFPSIELSVPSMDSMDSLFNPSEQGSVMTPNASGKGRARLKWTAEMDHLLLQAVNIYGGSGVGMWKKVAEYVSQHMTQPILDDSGNLYEVKITNHQCGERYKHHLDPNIQHRNTDPWTNEEIDRLRELVERYQILEAGTTNSGRSRSQINWVKISGELNRNYRDCQHKWTAVSKASLKIGAFTKEEEQYILNRVTECREIGSAIWTDLERELGRKRRSIQDKYNYLTKKKKSFTGAVPT